MNILNKPTATYEQCEAWVRKKTTNEVAIKNTPLLWKAAISNGIDPVVMIAQAMLETGFFTFKGGVIDASYHNTCGLKTTKGGACNVAGSHMRFKNWEEGIQAHADHLGLYAGSPNCPKYSPECASSTNEKYKCNGTTKDPRHFTYLYGKNSTVESLTGTWAMDKQYDTKLKSMINEIRNTDVNKSTETMNNNTCTNNKVNDKTCNKVNNKSNLGQALKNTAFKNPIQQVLKGLNKKKK